MPKANENIATPQDATRFLRDKGNAIVIGSLDDGSIYLSKSSSGGYNTTFYGMGKMAVGVSTRIDERNMRDLFKDALRNGIGIEARKV